MIQKQKLGKNFPFFFWFNYGFPWLKKKTNNFTFAFSDIVSIIPALFLRSFV